MKNLYFSTFLNITDRLVYALRARGFNNGEDFNRIQEAVSIYHSHIKKIQPKCPYAIAGYSFGAMLAFETSKILESQKDEVPFLGSFDLSPHIKPRMRELDWVEVALTLSYFPCLMTEEHAHKISLIMHKLSHDELLDYILQRAAKYRLLELSLGKAKFTTWISVAHSMHYSAREYIPQGLLLALMYSLLILWLM